MNSPAGRPTTALVVTPHPLSLHGQRRLSAEAACFEPGDTLASLLQRQGVSPGAQWVVSIGGAVVPEAMWARVRPRHGHLIECRRVPQKDVLRIVAIAALAWFTMGAGGIGGASGSFLGFTGVAGKALAYGAFLAGSLVINKMLAPKMPGRQDSTASPTYSLNGGRNRARAFETMALVLGEPYAVPDIGAQPYTYFANGEQYLWQIFHLGINCADVQNLRIGQTPIGQYQGVTLLRNGLASGNSEFPALGTSVDSVAGGAVNYGVPVVRVGSAGTVRLAIDLVAQLFAINGAGAFITNLVGLSVSYREVGSGTWLPFTDEIPGVAPVLQEVQNTDSEINNGQNYWVVVSPGRDAVPAGYVYLSNASQRPLRVTLEKAVPPGHYEVQISKGSLDTSGSSEANVVEWVQLRSYQQDLADYGGQARLAVQIQASGQLNGSLDEVNVVLRAKPMPYWNGSAWVTATDRASGLCNPGALFLLLVRGIFDEGGRRLAGLGYSDEQIDIEGLQLFMVRCAARGFEFDLNLQESMGILELLDAIAYAGLGEVAYPDGKIGVVFFDEAAPLEGVINMANIRARSFQVDYETMPTADEMEFQYFDRSRGYTWNSLRVGVPGVTNPRSTARVQLTGITSEAHASVLARFAMAQNVFQRKSISCEMDLEFMTFRRGAVVSLSHDLTQWGYSGRLVAAEDVAGEIHLTLDEPAQGTIPPGGAGRYIGLRLPGEMQPRIFPVQSFSGESRVVVLDAPWPSGVDLPGATTDNPAHDTVWVYDFKAVPGQRLVVAAIEPSNNGARVSLVPISAEFWDFVFNGTYTPPPNNSLLRPAPVISGVLVAEQLARQGNTFFTELTVSFDVAGAFARAELWGAVRGGDIAPDTLAMLATGSSQALSWRGGLDERWHLELRVYADARQAVPFRLIYDVQGLRLPPPDVQGLAVNGTTLSWEPVDVPDLAGYEVRFQYGTSTWWDTAVPLHTGLITESPYQLTRRPQGDVTVLIKAVDTTGNRSANAAAVAAGFAPIPVSNIAAAFPQHPDFLGDITDGTVDAGDLVADDTDAFYEPADGPMYLAEAEPMYGDSQFSPMVYEFSVSSTEAGRLALLYTISAESLLIEYQVGGADPMYEPGSDPMYEPDDEPIYGEFGAWAVWPGSIEFDGRFEVRFRLTLAGGLTQGVIYDLTAVVDAPEISEQLEDVPIGAGGTRLALTNTYRAIKTVQLTLQADGGSGVSTRVQDKNPDLGPLVEVLNNAGTSVDGVLDAVVRGY